MWQQNDFHVTSLWDGSWGKKLGSGYMHILTQNGKDLEVNTLTPNLKLEPTF